MGLPTLKGATWGADEDKEKEKEKEKSQLAAAPVARAASTTSRPTATEDTLTEISEATEGDTLKVSCFSQLLVMLYSVNNFNFFSIHRFV